MTTKQAARILRAAGVPQQSRHMEYVRVGERGGKETTHEVPGVGRVGVDHRFWDYGYRYGKRTTKNRMLYTYTLPDGWSTNNFQTLTREVARRAAA